MLPSSNTHTQAKIHKKEFLLKAREMCGGAIIADLIPAARSDCRSPVSQPRQAKNKRPWRGHGDDDFEAAFEEFDGDPEEEAFEMDDIDNDDADKEEALAPFGFSSLFPQGEARPFP